MLTTDELLEVLGDDTDTLTTREVTFTCGHTRICEDISACQKDYLERHELCLACKRIRDEKIIDDLSKLYGDGVRKAWEKHLPAYYED
ncbi:hypothetical protein [Bifidobacterium callitrichidarum]|uniref:Uncharacterized protein n=1 Tax=Bifidobacterium callitrichidarum TaxID=2052941 RepID=A0A2U2NCA8_9BIFI|nr:hypothetical protein [Bifidobacterium callitrichidarum]PWG66727.1 hypothetical protein DF196_02155 [Bifidobacterium callitrichidarum]